MQGCNRCIIVSWFTLLKVRYFFHSYMFIHCMNEAPYIAENGWELTLWPRASYTRVQRALHEHVVCNMYTRVQRAHCTYPARGVQHAHTRACTVQQYTQCVVLLCVRQLLQASGVHVCLLTLLPG